MRVGALALLLGSGSYAQDIEGDWQGRLNAGAAEIRVVISIEQLEDGGWKATEFTPDEGSSGVVADSVTLQDSTLKLTFDRIRGAYEGRIGQDGASIAGTWIQGGAQGQSFPLDLQRATKESSWLRDTASHSIQFVSVENDVKLEVLDWGGSGRPLVLLAGGGNNAHGFDKFAPKLIDTYHV